MNAEGALQVIAECHIELLDYGMIDQEPFFCTCGVGFDAFISDRFAKAGRRGLLTYIENTLKEGLKYKPSTARSRSIRHSSLPVPMPVSTATTSSLRPTPA